MNKFTKFELDGVICGRTTDPASVWKVLAKAILEHNEDVERWYGRRVELIESPDLDCAAAEARDGG